MIYNIYKTSDWFKTSEPSKPCEKAKLKRIDNFNDAEYIIEINTLEDLQELIKEVGRIIIDEDIIEIYDDYRE